jgi:hypothetical protein
MDYLNLYSRILCTNLDRKMSDAIKSWFRDSRSTSHSAVNKRSKNSIESSEPGIMFTFIKLK